MFQNKLPHVAEYTDSRNVYIHFELIFLEINLYIRKCTATKPAPNLISKLYIF